MFKECNGFVVLCELFAMQKDLDIKKPFVYAIDPRDSTITA